MRILDTSLSIFLKLLLIVIAAYFIADGLNALRFQYKVSHYLTSTTCDAYVKALENPTDATHLHAYLSATADFKTNFFLMQKNPFINAEEILPSTLITSCRENPQATVFQAFEKVNAANIETRIKSDLDSGTLSETVKIKVTSPTTPSSTTDINQEWIEPSAGPKK